MRRRSHDAVAPRGVAVRWLVLGVAIVSGLGMSQAAEPDARLDRPLRAEQPRGDLRDYLARISAETAVQHAAREPVEARPLVVSQATASLRRIQEALAALYQASWLRSADATPRYTLAPGPSDLRARSRATATMQAGARVRLIERWRAVSRLAFLPPEQLRRAAQAELALVRCLGHPRGQAATRAAFSLPPAMVEQTFSAGRAVAAVSALPSPVQTLVKKAYRGDRADLTGDEILAGTAELRLGGAPDRPTVWFRLRVGGGGVDTNLLYAEGWTRQPPEDRRRAARARPTPTPKDPRFRIKVTLREPASRSGIQPGERPPGAKPLGILLKDLTEQMDLPLLAEVEHRLPRDDPEGRWLGKQWWLAADLVKRPLPEVLDMLCADFECEWRFERGFLLIRPRLWFLEPEEREYAYPK